LPRKALAFATMLVQAERDDPRIENRADDAAACTCVMRAPTIVVRHRSASLKTAMDEAMQRAVRNVRRTLQRRNLTQR